MYLFHLSNATTLSLIFCLVEHPKINTILIKMENKKRNQTFIQLNESVKTRKGLQSMPYAVCTNQPYF